jgi:hypothetical protein
MAVTRQQVQPGNMALHEAAECGDVAELRRLCALKSAKRRAQYDVNAADEVSENVGTADMRAGRLDTAAACC